MYRPPSPNAARAAEDGFTLVEALAALTIAMIGLGALAELTHSSVLSTRYVEHRVALIQTARKAMTALPPRATIIDGELSGELDGSRWRIVARPFLQSSAPANGGWIPEIVALEVRSAQGDRIEIETLRIRKAGAR